jgi:RNase P protein component
MISPHTPTRLSVIVPIKVSKRATTRNSFKRLAYDAAWKMLKDKKLDCIIMFKPIALIKGKGSMDLISHELLQSTSLL